MVEGGANVCLKLRRCGFKVAIVVVTWFWLVLLVESVFRLHLSCDKVARKTIVVDTRGFRAVWNGLKMFEYLPDWC